MKKKVVIIGCGFAGQAAARRLGASKEDLRVSVIDKNRAASFLPLLPDVLGRGVPAQSLTYPLDAFCRRLRADFINEEAVSVDTARREVATATRKIAYDYLIVACGSQTAFFGQEGLKKTAFTLDSAADALRIQEALRSKPRIKTCLIVGGGYTGVEIAGNLRRSFERCSSAARVVIVEKAEEILGALPAWMKTHVRRNLKQMNIEVLTQTVLKKAEGDTFELSDGRVFDRALLIWCAGVRIPDFVQKMAVEKNPQGRIHVDRYLMFADSAFAAGDAAFFLHQRSPLRMAVQFAICQGDAAALNIIRASRGKALRHYTPLDLGYVIPLASNDSCGVIAGMKVRGRIATWLHYFMCVYRSSGLRRRLSITGSLLQGGRLHMIDFALLILRIGLGVMFFAHGLQHAFGFFGGSGMQDFAKMLEGLKFAQPLVWAHIASYTLLAGGVFLVVGFLTRVSSAALLIFISVAAWTVHWQKGFFMQQGGFEYNFVIACACLALILAGPGRFGISKKW